MCFARYGEFNLTAPKELFSYGAKRNNLALSLSSKFSFSGRRGSMCLFSFLRKNAWQGNMLCGTIWCYDIMVEYAPKFSFDITAFRKPTKCDYINRTWQLSSRKKCSRHKTRSKEIIGQISCCLMAESLLVCPNQAQENLMRSDSFSFCLIQIAIFFRRSRWRKSHEFRHKPTNSFIFGFGVCKSEPQRLPCVKGATRKENMPVAYF